MRLVRVFSSQRVIALPRLHLCAIYNAAEDIKVTSVVVAYGKRRLVVPEYSEIGELEAEVINAVKKLKNGTAADVQEYLRPSRELAYTTVGTTLDRLHRKGFLGRRPTSGKGGLRYVYSFAQDSGLEKTIVNKTIDRLVNAFGPSVASNIHDRLDELSQDDKEKLKHEIERRKTRN
jgi:predicted transcriptional regulator